MTSAAKLLKQVNKVLFEGPLDEISMSKVVDAGLQGDRSDCILDELDEATVAKIAKILVATDSSMSVEAGLEMFLTAPDVSIRSMVEGMKPWMAFFQKPTPDELERRE